jgi:hypothetical protein
MHNMPIMRLVLNMLVPRVLMLSFKLTCCMGIIVVLRFSIHYFSSILKYLPTYSPQLSALQILFHLFEFLTGDLSSRKAAFQDVHRVTAVAACAASGDDGGLDQPGDPGYQQAPKQHHYQYPPYTHPVSNSMHDHC